MFYLITILIGVGWILFSVIKNYSNTKSPISHKYSNHGRNVPTQKCSKFKRNPKISTTIRTYSTLPNNSIPNKVYKDLFSMKNANLKENIGKSGIYMLTNKLTGDIYVGQSINISNRFKNYFNISYIKSKERFIINRALIKYANFPRFYTSIVTKNSLVPVTQIGQTKDPWFLTGFSDAESCFSINIFKNIKSNFGWKIQAVFTIGLHKKDTVILDQIKATLGVGEVYKHGENTRQYIVNSFSALATLISHFDKYPLITQKRADYFLFKMAVGLINNKEHLTAEGFRKILAIKASINLG